LQAQLASSQAPGKLVYVKRNVKQMNMVYGHGQANPANSNGQQARLERIHKPMAAQLQTNRS
jgi:hypothetical protein